jgi:cytochrome c oxidase cbb3-type subunit III
MYLFRRAMFASSLLCLALCSCEREKRSFRVAAASADAPESIPVNNRVRAGGVEEGKPATGQSAKLVQLTDSPFKTLYPRNAQAMSDGQTLYEAFNCSGCHSHGGGGIGPPLLDNKWYYGSDPQQVYASIVEGRPNGMPSFRGRIPDYQVWEIVAYVKSLSGNAKYTAAVGREDHMRTTMPPNTVPKEKAVIVPEPTTQPIGTSAPSNGK